MISSGWDNGVVAGLLALTAAIATDEEAAPMVLPEPRRVGATRPPDTTCTWCGTPNSTRELKATALRRAIAAFVLIPAVTVTLTIVLGVEPAIANAALTATAWTVLGVPAAALALRSAARPACRYCGSPDLAETVTA